MSPLRPAIVAALILAALTIAAIAAQAGSSAGTVASSQQATAHHLYGFHGTVTRTDPSHHWVQIHTAATNKLIRFQTHQATHSDNCDWAELHHGHAIAVRAYQNNGTWIATRISDWHHTAHAQHHTGGD